MENKHRELKIAQQILTSMSVLNTSKVDLKMLFIKVT